MILIYSQLPFDKSQIYKQRDFLKERLTMFLVDNDSFIFSTESNLTLLKELVINHKVSLFYANSIRDTSFTVSELSDLIKYLLINGNNGIGCKFRFETEKLYFNKNKIDSIESIISDHLNSKQ
jgi:hypothetical protein